MTLAAEILEEGRVHRFLVQDDRGPLSFATALEGLSSDEELRSFLVDLLSESPFEAYFWETPPVTSATLRRPFEFVLVDAPALARVPAEPDAFRGHYSDAHEGVATFWNLGRDALLVAPVPEGDYAHLAAFTRSASLPEQHALWRAVGNAARERLGDEPLWISTSGLGISWLHVRLDRTPKYYTHAPYRSG